MSTGRIGTDLDAQGNPGEATTVSGRTASRLGGPLIAGLIGLGAGLLMATIGWHARGSDWNNGQVLVSSHIDERLHTLGWWTLSLGVALGALSLAMTLGRRRLSSRVLPLIYVVAAVSVVGAIFVAARYNDIASVCACTS